VPVVTGFLVAATASSSHAQDVTHTFTAVDCTAVVGTTTLHQIMDISIEVIAPDTVTPGSSFTITIPGGTAALPTRSNGLSISTYSNLFQTLQLNGANFSGGIVNPGTASFVPSTLGASAWSNLSTFANGVYVYINEAPVTTPPTFDWHYFRSLVAGNLNHPPQTSPAQWVEVPATEPTLWHSVVSYNNSTLGWTSFNGIVYKSLVTPNLNHQPDISPVQWQAQPNPLTTPESVTSPPSGGTANQVKFGAGYRQAEVTSTTQWGGDTDGIAEPIVNALRAAQRATNPSASSVPVRAISRGHSKIRSTLGSQVEVLLQP
jgi:hypothetical protein